MPKFEHSKDRKNKRDPKERFSKRDSKRDSGSEKSFAEFSKNRKDSGRGSSHGARNRRDFEMTKVVCSSCGSNCEVPFKPTSNKPIFCSDCFRKEEKGSSSKTSSKDFDIINKKLDKIIKALEIE